MLRVLASLGLFLGGPFREASLASFLLAVVLTDRYWVTCPAFTKHSKSRSVPLSKLPQVFANLVVRICVEYPTPVLGTTGAAPDLGQLSGLPGAAG